MSYDFDGERFGTYRVKCDISGFTCNAEDTVVMWNGLRVHRDFADPRHPLDFQRPLRPSEPPQNPRPVEEIPVAVSTADAWALIASE